MSCQSAQFESGSHYARLCRQLTFVRNISTRACIASDGYAKSLSPQLVASLFASSVTRASSTTRHSTRTPRWQFPRLPTNGAG